MNHVNALNFDDIKKQVLFCIQENKVNMDELWPDEYNWKKIEENRGSLKSWYEILDEKLDSAKKLDKFLKTYNLFLNFVCFEKVKTKYLATTFNVIGCPTSTDIDICVNAPLDIVEAMKKYEIELDSTQIIDDLSTLGYDIQKKLDINVICTQNGQIISHIKGGIDTTNIIFYTYQYHKQKYPRLVANTVNVSLYERIRITAKYILDNEKIFMGGKKTDSKDIRRIAYENTNNMVDRATKLLNLFEWNSSMMDCFKSMTIKFIQMQLASSNLPICYTKQELIHAGSQFFDENALTFLLFRGTRGKIEKVPSTLDDFKHLFVQLKKRLFENQEY